MKNTAISNPVNGSTPASGKLWGYIRVSTREQNEARQVVALREFGVPDDHVFMDKQSGKDFNRPQYQLLLAQLSPGDVLELVFEVTVFDTEDTFYTETRVIGDPILVTDRQRPVIDQIGFA